VSRAHWGETRAFLGASDTIGLVHSDKNHTTEHLSTAFISQSHQLQHQKPLKLMHANISNW